MNLDLGLLDPCFPAFLIFPPRLFPLRLVTFPVGLEFLQHTRWKAKLLMPAEPLLVCLEVDRLVVPHASVNQPNSRSNQPRRGVTVAG